MPAKESPTFFLRTRIPTDRYEQATYVLDRLGLKPQDAVNAFFAQIVLSGGIPFPLLTDELDPLLKTADQGRIWDETLGEWPQDGEGVKS